jgi:hypothetical protein
VRGNLIEQGGIASLRSQWQFTEFGLGMYKIVAKFEIIYNNSSVF